MRAVLFVMMLLIITPAYSQDVKQQINSIKKNAKYINAEATDESREEAFSMALEELTDEANSLFASNVLTNELKTIAKSLELKRGESMRVFAYVLKEDIRCLIASRQNSSPVVPSQPTPSRPTPPLPVAVSSAQAGKVTSVFSRMNTLTEIKSLLRQYKEEGKLYDFNWVSSSVVSAEAAVIIFRDEKIVAILLQENNGKRMNYLTNKEDNISNYSGCRAIWYKEKKE